MESAIKVHSNSEHLIKCKENKRITIISLFVIFPILLLINIDFTSIYILIPPIAKNFNLTTAQSSWLVTLYLLFFGVPTIISGRLGDIYGQRPLLYCGLSLFALSSLLCGLTHNYGQLLIARSLQGLSAALMWPNITVIGFNLFPKSKKNMGIAIVVSAIGFGMALGPIFGGMITSYFGWRWVFFMNIPLSIVIGFFLLALVGDCAKIKSPSISFLGPALLILALGSFILGLNQLPTQSNLYAYSICFIIISLILGAIFLFIERKATRPILSRKIRNNRLFWHGCALRIVSVTPFYIVLFVISALLENNFRLNPFKTGLLFLPLTATMGICSLINSKISRVICPRLMLTTSAVSYIAGFIILLTLIPTSQYWLISLTLAFIGLGFSFASSAALSIGIHSVPIKMQGAATGVFYTASMTTGLITIAASSYVLSYFDSGLNVSDAAFHLIMTGGVVFSLILMGLSLKRIQ